jgi:hypothetical protein
MKMLDKRKYFKELLADGVHMRHPTIADWKPLCHLHVFSCQEDMQGDLVLSR